MDGRSKNVQVLLGDSVDVEALTKRYRCKYLCRSCRQLRMPNPGEWPTSCGNCHSLDIDCETDFRSQRLEVIRLGGYPVAQAKLLEEIANMSKEQTHTCLGGVTSTEPSWWEKDAQNIPLARVCIKCKAEKLSKFTRKTLTGYDQRDVDEPIDESP